tara:strand:- start:58367 stop:58807 length:441 start_codon:yes stop_codon:yes gene_type:complete
MPEVVSIQDASRILNVSKRVIRQYIQDGKLNGFRQPKPHGGSSWVVEIPEGAWLDEYREHIYSVGESTTPWWRPTPNGSGIVHYVESLGIEEVSPLFICGIFSKDIWPAINHSTEDRCQECVNAAQAKGLPLDSISPESYSPDRLG